MKICTECNKEVEKYKHGKKCEGCRRKYLRERHEKKQIHECLFCKEKFYKLKLKECSIKCYLLNRIEKDGECWIWKKQLNSSGYGKLKINTKHSTAHRESYKIFNGEIPEGMLILHSCNKPACINPEHLRLGTHKDNMQDRTEAGSVSGERNPSAILTNDQVNQIKKMLSENLPQAHIGRLFGVGRHVIHFIKHKRTWKDDKLYKEAVT
jgi:hypothetical protein